MGGVGPFQPGDQCNQYQIVRALGSGGFGCVYEARRELAMMMEGVLQNSEQAVAIKCLQVCHARDAVARERLNQEAVILKELKHNNIVRFVDCGISEGGVEFFVMELLEGKTLAAHLKDGRFSVRRSLEVARDIASGLAFSHKKGVIHRDLKPANVFVNDSEIKVLDLGAAKYHYGCNPSNSGGQSPLTVMYAAPEQLDGSGKVDHRADVFALGVITYEMLTGQHPFRGGAQTMGEYIGHQIQCRVRPLSEFGIPEDVASIVHRALSRRPEDRGSMAELRDALSRHSCSCCNKGDDVDEVAILRAGGAVGDRGFVGDEHEQRAEPMSQVAGRFYSPELLASRVPTGRVANPLEIFEKVTRPNVQACVVEKVDSSRTNQVVESSSLLVRDGPVFDRPAVRGAIARVELASVRQFAEPKPHRPRKLGWGVAAFAAAFVLALPVERMVANGSWRRAPDLRAAAAPVPAAPISAMETRKTAQHQEASKMQGEPAVGELDGVPVFVTTAAPIDSVLGEVVKTEHQGGPLLQKKQQSQRSGAVPPVSRTEKEARWLENPFKSGPDSTHASTVGELGVVPLPASPSWSAPVGESSQPMTNTFKRKSPVQKKQVSPLYGIHVPQWATMGSVPVTPGDTDLNRGVGR